MTTFAIPWLELSLIVPLAGAGCVSLVRNPLTVSRWCLAFAAATLACSLMACISFYSGHVSPLFPWRLWDGGVLNIDELNAPLLPLLALLHLLTVLATARTKMARFSFQGLLAGLALRMTAFSCIDPWPLIALLALDACLPVLEIRRRGRPFRSFAIHALLFVALLAIGWACMQSQLVEAGSLLLLAAVLVRTGGFPAQIWIKDAFDAASFGSALLFATPLAGVYAAVRLILPFAPEWTLELLQWLALGSAAYAACMSVVQLDGRRLFAFLFISHGALVLVGLGLDTPFAVTGALVMWLSAALSLAGLGLTLRALEARVGLLSLREYRGLYDQSPGLAVCFLVTGLAAVGFPGTSGFIAVELLVDEAVGDHESIGLIVVLIAAMNGIAVVRAYLLLFTGRRHATGVSLGITPRERVAVLTIIALIIAGGLLPQVYLESRQRAAAAVLRERHIEPAVFPFR